MGERISLVDLAVIDRRQLLRGAAAATAISGLPPSEPAVAAPQEIEGTNLADWSRFSTATCTTPEPAPSLLGSARHSTRGPRGRRLLRTTRWVLAIASGHLSTAR